MDWKGFLMDHMGHFSVYDIPSLAFSFLLAALLGFLVGRVAFGNMVYSRELALWAAIVALGTGLAGSQISLAIVLVGILLAARSPASDRRDGQLRSLAMVLGMGCGAGAALITVVLALPAMILLRWSTSSASDG